MWPAFAALTVAEGVLGHALPISGDSQTVLGAAIVAAVLNLILIVVLRRPLGALLRRVRTDLPRLVARDYAGTGVLLCVSLGLAIGGLVHHPTVRGHEHALRDAIVRAQAFIGDRAPVEFRVNISHVSTVTIEPGNVYRTCVRSAVRERTYCVIVQTKMPFASSVRFAGYEPNSVFSQGTG